jgi:enoyl-CoA hydratase
MLRLEQDGRVLRGRHWSPPRNFATTTFIRDLDRLTSAVARDPTMGAVVRSGGVEGRILTQADSRDLGDLQSLPHRQLSMRLLQPVVPLLILVLRLPGLVPALERFGGPPGKAIVWGYRWKRTILRMNRSPVVYLAAINRSALAGGQQIALACEVRYAAGADHLRTCANRDARGHDPGRRRRQPAAPAHARHDARARLHPGMRAADGAGALAAALDHRLVRAERLLGETHATSSPIPGRG